MIFRERWIYLSDFRDRFRSWRLFHQRFQRKRQTFFFYLFSKRESSFFHFLSISSSSTIDFSTLSLFFSNHRKRSKVEWRSSQFWLFFSRDQKLSNAFFFKLREISVDANQFERQRRNLRRCFVSMKKKKRKDDERRKNLSFIRINEREIETFQRIRHHEIRKFNRSNRIFENERKNFENQNDFDYFFHRNSSFSLELIVNFLFFETNFVKTSTETYISEYHLHRSDSDIKIRAIRHSSIEHRCKSHRRVIQCDQQQHRYIVSFDR